MKRSNHLVDLDPWVLELWEEMRREGMALSLEQGDWLRQALALGYGLAGWEDLQRICQWLWVRPTPNYAQDKFDRAFRRFRHHHQLEPEILPPPPPEPQPGSPELPRIPPRKFPAPEPPPSQESPQVPAAVRVPPGLNRSPKGKQGDFLLTPRGFPISLPLVKRLWRSLCRPSLDSLEWELDLDGTLASLQRWGNLSDIVLRPIRIHKAELILLVDDSNVMVPFRPALEPFLQGITQRWMAPAQIYRFKGYPDPTLNHWQYPYHPQPLRQLLTQWHPDSTLVVIWSEGGAATGTKDDRRIDATAKFLNQVNPCIRQLFWINPLPPHRWQHTSAEAINRLLHGTMVALTEADLYAAVKGLIHGERFTHGRSPRLGK